MMCSRDTCENVVLSWNYPAPYCGPACRQADELEQRGLAVRPFGGQFAAGLAAAKIRQRAIMAAAAAVYDHNPLTPVVVPKPHRWWHRIFLRPR